MDIRNCSRCGKIFSYDGFDVCQQCRREEEEEFQKVKKYIEENPGANTHEVSEETGVSVSKIVKFLRQGRLQVADGSNIVLDCERCGAPIKTGRFCNQCLVEIDEDIKKSIGKAEKPKGLGNGAKEKIEIMKRYKRK